MHCSIYTHSASGSQGDMLSRLIQWVKSLRIKPQLKALLRSLVDYWNISKSNPWPSISRLADELCVSRQTVHKYLNQLENAGIIARKHRYRTNGGKTSNSYSLLHRLHGYVTTGLHKDRARECKVHAASHNAISTKLDRVKPKPQGKRYTINADKMSTLDECQKNYRISIDRKWITGSDRDKLSYFSCWAKVVRKSRDSETTNPAALLVHVLKNDLLHHYPDNIDEQKAIKIIRELRAFEVNGHMSKAA
mgnify:CR=1 FL=1